MSIVAVQALPRSVIESIVHHNGGRMVAEGFDPEAIWVVAIHGHGKEPVNLRPDPKVLHVQCDDIEPSRWADDHDPSWMEAEGLDVSERALQVRDAQRIVEHVLRAQARVRDVLFVAHCAAGISRSGAVALFAGEVAGIPHSEFQAMCPQAQPNGHILRLLRWCRGPRA